jgi:adenosylcobyric acid synthase
VSGPLARRGALLVCGTTSDAGKSFVVAGLCRLLARQGVAVAPFKAQNMALNASVTRDGAEIGHAQWIQAVAAGVEPEAAMNPVLLKPTGDRTCQVVVMGRAAGERSAADYQRTQRSLFPVVLDALADLRRRFDVVVCEGAGSPAEINLLDRDIVTLPLAREAGMAAIVVGDIDRGGVFASLYGTVALLPDDLRATVRGFVVNKLRGDPALLGDACEQLERRTGVPTLGIVPHVGVDDIDNEDSLALDRPDPDPGASAGNGDGTGDVLDVAALRWPRVANAGDLDPLRLEPRVHVRWVRSAAQLGRPDLVVLPGSKNTRADLAWFRSSGLAEAVGVSGAPVIGVCAGLQMLGRTIADPAGVEGAPGAADGLGWLAVDTAFAGDKVLDRPGGVCIDGPGAGRTVAGYRIHHGRVRPVGGAGGSTRWLVSESGDDLGWRSADGRVCGTTLHGLFERDDFREAVLAWTAERAGKPWSPGRVRFAEARLDRLDRIADVLERHLDLPRLGALIEDAARDRPGAC